MAALQNAGMSVEAPRIPSVVEDVPAERPPEAPRIVSPAFDLPSNGYPTSPPSSARARRPLPPTPGVSNVPLVEALDVPSSAGMRGPSPVPPQDDSSRPASAPAIEGRAELPTQRPGISTLVDPASSEPTAMTSFGRNFPSLDEFDTRFPDVPAAEPANGIPASFSAPSPTDFGAFSAMKRSPAHPALETLRNPPQESVNQFSEDGAVSRSKPTLPRTNFILPDALWAYLQPPSEDQPTVLLLDVRDRAEFERYRIRATHNVCIEPLTLRSDISSQRLEASLVLSPDEERQAFCSRDQFDLVVIYDRSSTTIPSHAPAVSMQGGEDPARCLYNLHAAIFEREYHRSLRRPPVILVGGIEAWMKGVGSQGLQGSEAATAAMARTRSSASVAEASARLEGATNGTRRSSLSGSNEVKRNHRKASIPPAEGFYGQPSLSRSVVDAVRCLPVFDVFSTIR